MIALTKSHIYLLSGIKKLRHFYVLTKCPLVYSIVLSINRYRFKTQKMEAAKICVEQNI